MVLFFPNADYTSTYRNYKPIGINFPVYPDWNADAVLDFARHVIVVPKKDLYSDLYLCEPEIFCLDGIKKLHAWFFYMTEGSNRLAGEGIYPDDDKARILMPELPFYKDDDKDKPERVPVYLDDEHLGHKTWIEGPFATVEEAKEEWRKRCSHAHRQRWDEAHLEGRLRLAHLHAAEISKRKNPFAVVLSRTEVGARGVFMELIGRMKDQANDDALACQLAEVA
ncbi:hypothetical protein V5O48_008139 [Marasmius crinis-equi]|uniref:Uncharacterized protein n=1 Tax=Marasmius crinis-equi TaxID=585013 RepID=A0ABR3FEQ5_9AGAR